MSKAGQVKARTENGDKETAAATPECTNPNGHVFSNHGDGYKTCSHCDARERHTAADEKRRQAAVTKEPTEKPEEEPEE